MADVERNTDKPRLKLLWLAEQVDTSKGAEERVLRQVLGDCVMAHLSPNKPIDSRLMLLHQRPKRIVLSPLRRSDELDGG